MNGLLVLSLTAAASAQVALPLGYAGLGYGYAGLAGYPYAYGHNLIKPVIKEIEVPVEHIQYAAHVTGCTNSFGNAVPCLQEGEARKKRAADEEAAAVEAPAAAAVAPLAYGLPLGYAGLGYAGLGYAGLGYAGLGYAGLGYPYAAPVAHVAPTVTEVEVPQYKYVPTVKTVELPPACQNAFGFAVPCA